MGSRLSGGLLTGLLEPPTAIVPFEGIRSDGLDPTFGYPEFMDDDDMCEWFYRFRIFSFDLSYSMFGVDEIGRNVTVGGGASGVLLSAQHGGDDERALANAFSYGAQGGFVGLQTGLQTNTIEGDPPATTAPVFFQTQFNVSPQTDGLIDPNPIVPYYYHTSGLWLPVVDLHADGGGHSFVPKFTTSTPMEPGSVEQAVMRTAQINGFSVDIKVIIQDFLFLDEWSLEITPIKWWPYDHPDDFEGPIWNENTGALLRDYRTQVGV